MKTYNWTTAKGAKVELTIEERTYTETLADGAIEEERTYKAVEEMTVNGMAIEGAAFKGDRAIEFNLRGNRQVALIPEDVQEQVWGEERKAMRARLEKEEAAEKKYQEGKAKIERAL